MRTRTILRLVAGCGTLVYLTPFALLTLFHQVQRGYDPIETSFGLVVATFAILCWWFALRGNSIESLVHMKLVVVGGLILGVVGFAAGFFGPIIFSPKSNQGPLLGIFVTGPLGFVVGTVLCWLYVVVRSISCKW
jgi:hypothetical protein